jgi:hypothetical protein
VLALKCERRVAPDYEGASEARQIGRQAFGDAVDEIVLFGIAAHVREGQDDDRPARRGRFFGRCSWSGLRLGGMADIKGIHPDCLGDVLELRRAEIVDGEIEPSLDLPVGLLGQTDRAGLGKALQTCGDIDAVAHQIAVTFLDDIAQVNADAELDAALGRKAGIAFNEAGLHLDGAAHGVDHAAELDQSAVAGPLDGAPVMRGDSGVDEIAAKPAQARERALFVSTGKPAVAYDVRDQDSRDLPGSRH